MCFHKHGACQAQGTDEEDAARTLGASEWDVFWNVTLPNIKWGLLYGIILTNAVRADALELAHIINHYTV